jgi:hypothetical protein
MKQLNIAKIIDYLNNNLTVPVYHWLPLNESNSNYIVVSIINENLFGANKNTILNFSFNCFDDNWTFGSLLTLRETVSNLFFKNVAFSNDFNCYLVAETGNFKEWYNEKNRKTISQDYKFYFVI